jgi:hypothetical protein
LYLAIPDLLTAVGFLVSSTVRGTMRKLISIFNLLIGGAAVLATSAFLSGPIARPDRISAANRRSPANCFVSATAVVWHGQRDYTIRRVVSSGIRRFDDDGAGTPSECTPVNRLAIPSARLAATQRIDSTHSLSIAEFAVIELRGTSVERIRAELLNVESKAHAHPNGFAHVEVVSLRNYLGVEPDETPIRVSTPADSAARACGRDNDDLKRRAASFRWLC